MPDLSGPLQAEGALVDVAVGWSTARARALRRALRPVPPPVDVRALLDTGAETTALDPSLVRALSLPLAAIAFANVPGGGLTIASQHDVSMTVFHPSGDPQLNFVVRDLIVIELGLGAMGYQALIGRDVLAGCEFLYDGRRGQYRLSY